MPQKKVVDSGAGIFDQLKQGESTTSKRDASIGSTPEATPDAIE